MIFNYFVGFVSLIAIGRYAEASMDDFKEKYSEMLIECMLENPLTDAETESLKNKEVPATDNAKCFLACSYKKMGAIDEQGKFSVETIKKLSREYLTGADVDKADKFLDACRDVNDLAVSDGVKGCDRSALLLKCAIEKGDEFEL